MARSSMPDPAWGSPDPTGRGSTPPDRPAEDPGRMLGIIGIGVGATGFLVAALLLSPIGLIVNGIALGRSRRAGYRNVFAIIGLVLSAVCFIWIVYRLMTGSPTVSAG
ncbi:hypothetical protein GCM10025865_14290 [Paraoerskovia sediminicola]|uniref:DUF4190 domain-containing protein n=1 Tax=Paraoerskovia sediminicola TaxID=1138587 RepID=A0ABM8G286_9CELL|nr:hypothetical protein [Paraoerskovia sediminicola]BDZ42130.1 hypothetical protein GCM10025865_14290 [Paraoerskovia sediminicola]